MSRPRVRAVVLDVGETLIDETAVWEAWADWLGVPHFTFTALLGATIALDLGHRRAFGMLRPGIDVRAEIARRAECGDEDVLTLYPDAVGCIEALRAQGRVVGVAANQPHRAVERVAAMLPPLDLAASSEGWGVAKPSPAFFARLARELRLPPHDIAYVGDRLDNDVLPAVAAGMVAVHVRRGPWGYLHAERPEMEAARLRVAGLAELPDALLAAGL